MLRKCLRPEQVCLEVALRARTKIDGDTVLADKSYVYTAERFRRVEVPEVMHYARLPGHPWWEEMTDETSLCRPIAEYCSENALARIKSDISDALTALVSRAVKDLSLAPEPE